MKKWEGTSQQLLRRPIEMTRKPSVKKTTVPYQIHRTVSVEIIGNATTTNPTTKAEGRQSSQDGHKAGSGEGHPPLPLRARQQKVDTLLRENLHLTSQINEYKQVTRPDLEDGRGVSIRGSQPTVALLSHTTFHHPQAPRRLRAPTFNWGQGTLGRKGLGFRRGT